MIPGEQLLLWVQPLNPPAGSPGYFLQRAPESGIMQEPTAMSDAWTGRVQVGNTPYPPQSGNTVNLLATVVSAADAAKLQSGDPNTPVQNPLNGATLLTQARNLTILITR